MQVTVFRYVSTILHASMLSRKIIRDRICTFRKLSKAPISKKTPKSVLIMKISSKLHADATI